jgi:hypothetical protein
MDLAKGKLAGACDAKPKWWPKRATLAASAPDTYLAAAVSAPTLATCPSC